MIIVALDKIKHSYASKFIIFTDSLCCLQALQWMKLEHPLIGSQCRSVSFVWYSNENITFCWLPSHVRIGGNEKAHLTANAALNLPHANLGILYTVLKYRINKYIMSNCRDEWNDVGTNKPHSVKPVYVEWQLYTHSSVWCMLYTTVTVYAHCSV